VCVKDGDARADDGVSLWFVFVLGGDHLIVGNGR
jgi:hypothetical protein